MNLLVTKLHGPSIGLSVLGIITITKEMILTVSKHLILNPNTHLNQKFKWIVLHQKKIQCVRILFTFILSLLFFWIVACWIVRDIFFSATSIPNLDISKVFSEINRLIYLCQLFFTLFFLGLGYDTKTVYTSPMAWLTVVLYLWDNHKIIHLTYFRVFVLFFLLERNEK